MKRFHCPTCAAIVFFTNDLCGSCSTPLVYSPHADDFVLGVDRCANGWAPAPCNWMAEPDGLCRNCWLDLEPATQQLALPFQSARRRTLRQLRRFGIDPAGLVPQLRFLLAASSDGAPVTTGHADGLITLDVDEGDPVRLAEVRADLGEPYRTPLGHVRHELGHWYWAVRVEYSADLESFREMFGDERRSYADALAAHYATPDDGSWRPTHITNYAASHPWEDFAETFAHYLHLTDTLESAVAHAMMPPSPPGCPFDQLYVQWIDLTTTLNELTRSMGVPDAYPFAPSPMAVDKLRWLHDLLEPAVR